MPMITSNKRYQFIIVWEPISLNLFESWSKEVTPTAVFGRPGDSAHKDVAYNTDTSSLGIDFGSSFHAKPLKRIGPIFFKNMIFAFKKIVEQGLEPVYTM